MTGISWFGCEGRGYIFTGLNYTSMDTILNFFVQHKFNTVRIPVSVAFALSAKDTKPNPKFVSKVRSCLKSIASLHPTHGPHLLRH